jgi:hypothetical protein
VRFTLVQSSLEYDDKDDQRVHDLHDTFQRGGLGIHFTEASGDDIRHAIKACCRLYGYEFVSGEGDSCFAVRDDAEVVEHGATVAVDAKRPQHGERAISWVHLTYRDEDIWMHGGHWLTGYRKNDYRLRMHKQMTATLVSEMNEHGRGRDVAFGLGDTNVDDRTDNDAYDDLLAEGGVVSVWDFLRNYPDTHDKRTIDVIFFRDLDARVRLVRARRYDGRRYKDHPDVGAVFEIEQGRG